MPKLLIEIGDAHHGSLRSVVTATADDSVSFRSVSVFSSPWTSQHSEKLAWLRDVLPDMLPDIQVFPGNPGPQISLKVGRQLLVAGVELFRNLFYTSPSSLAVWNEVKDELYRTEVEIVSTTRLAIPWEILRDPGTGKVLAESVRTFRITEALPMCKPAAGA